MTNSGNNKRIAINTALLYVRMLFAMFVSFFTTRIVLHVLGEENYGLANVVGGVISVFGFISVSLSTACSRFFSFEIGRGSEGRLPQVFSMMLLLYGAAAIMLFLLLETVGAWYIGTHLVCSESRMPVANVYYQIVVATVLIGWFVVPFSSLAIAYENMRLYAGLTVLDVFLKLLVAGGLLCVRDADVLVLFGVLSLIATSVHTLAYVLIVRRMYPNVRFSWWYDHKMFMHLLRFNGWRMFGVICWTTSDAFVNLLLNAFFGPVVNASRAIAMQIQGIVRSFTANFLTATNPQLVKYWSSSEKVLFYQLLERASKIGYFLVLFFALPLWIELPYVLEIWLGEVPSDVVEFTRLVLIGALINTVVLPLETAAQAVGDISKTEGFGNGSLLLVWPISYVALRCGGDAACVFIVSIGIAILRTSIYFYVVMRQIGLSHFSFLRNVVLRLMISTVISILIVFHFSSLFQEGILRVGLVGIMSSVCVVLVFLSIALSNADRRALACWISDRLKKIGVWA